MMRLYNWSLDVNSSFIHMSNTTQYNSCLGKFYLSRYILIEKKFFLRNQSGSVKDMEIFNLEKNLGSEELWEQMKTEQERTRFLLLLLYQLANR